MHPPNKTIGSNVHDYINRAKSFMRQYFPNNPKDNLSYNRNTGSYDLKQDHSTNSWDIVRENYKPVKFNLPGNSISNVQGPSAKIGNDLKSKEYTCQTFACAMDKVSFPNSNLKKTPHTTNFMNQLSNSPDYTTHKLTQGADNTYGRTRNLLQLLGKPNQYGYLYETDPLKGHGNHVRVAFSDNDSLYVVQDGESLQPIRKRAIALKDIQNYLNRNKNEDPNKRFEGGNGMSPAYNNNLNYLIKTSNSRQLFLRK